MTPLRDELRLWLTGVLEGIETEPRMYGSPESAELQHLLLLELLQFVMQPTRAKTNPRQVAEAYDGFLRRHFPDDGPHYLAGLLGEHGEPGRLASLLREFRGEIEGELGPENPFERYDLTVALRVRKGRPLPTASRIGVYYELFGRVLRGVARRSGKPGRLSQELEDVIALRPAAGFDLVPENGVGAQVIMPLEWPSAKQPHLPLVASAEEEVRADFARFLTVAEWAATERETIDEIVGAVPERDARTRMALEALRLLPRADGNLEAVEIGGRVVQRPRPVRLRPETHARLLTVVQEGRHPADFDREGVMRAADLDQGRFRLKFEDRSSRVVFLQDAELTERAASVLGRTVRVIGQEYTRPARAPFVVASSIEPVETDDLDDDDRA